MTFAEIVRFAGCPTAWSSACDFLKSQEDWRAYNLVVEITTPGALSARDKYVYRTVDEFLRKNDSQSLSTVANTIFPLSFYKKYGAEGVYEKYPAAFSKIKKHPSVHWGTYAQRMLRRKRLDGTEINPLRDLVFKLKKQLERAGPMRAVYELGIDDLSVDLPIYDPASDRKQPIGGPCLSHISCKLCPERRLLLTAIYRSHYYIERALGNFIGLAQLQAFICEQARIDAGHLVCVSTMAKLDRKSGSWGKRKIEDLLHACQDSGFVFE